MKSIAVLGSTGSIGIQALEVAKGLGVRVAGLGANENIDMLAAQIREFRPDVVCVGNSSLAQKLRILPDIPKTEILCGSDGMGQIASLQCVDTVVMAVVGLAALEPLLKAAASGKRIAMANKEAIVAAGPLLAAEIKRGKSKLVPVDSEQSAIFQCLCGNRKKDVSGIILTASGGPFRGADSRSLRNITKEQVLKHPVWKMGRKITVDSATLMNKGLEVIESRWLFNIALKNIRVLIHPQSIIHSMVEYVDGSVIAQMAIPDMRLPIQYALTWPERCRGPVSRTLDLAGCGGLTFHEPDHKTFPCIRIAYDALEAGGTMPAVMNAANEIAVRSFLEGELSFHDIPEVIKRVMDLHSADNNPGISGINEIVAADERSREEAVRIIERINAPRRLR